MTRRIILANVSKVFNKSNVEAGQNDSEDASHAGNYIRTAAVDDISLTIDEGQRVGIIGKNGAGKSTLLHIIAGLTSPTSGQVDVVGKVTSIMTLGIGLRDDLTGRENIYIDGEIQGKSRAEVDLVIDQIIDFSELGDFINYPVKTYSTGMKARLGFSMISCLDPEILIIDEALSVGDAAFSVKATARIREICSKGKIVIIVSHGMGSIRDICDRCLWIEGGRIIMDGAPDIVTGAYIDSVHSEDEANTLKEFTSNIAQPLSKPGYEILDILLIGEQGDLHSGRVESGRRLRINITAMQLVMNTKSYFNVKIIRLDDQVMFDEIFHVCDYSMAENKFGLEIEFNPLILGASIYRIDVTVVDDLGEGEEICARKSIMFEAFINVPPRGGKPMLFYSLSLESFLDRK